MRTPWPEIRLNAGGQRGVCDSFVQLKEMGMSAPHAYPNALWPAARRKAPQTVEWQEEGGKLNRAKIGAHFLLCRGGNITERGQREMNLIHGESPDTGNARSQPNEHLGDRFRQVKT